ncbi:hypothetical protein E3N88_19780 [Mikania micrantha]|uniref:F-box domain-containing protein n=1 Tax=Mikania micrantha TaxID=192012 RepID=A0A5N6NPV2_9ASTR|nr:hypothetical protein E3N88_19780 [Mikania micrantha]
MDTHNSDPPDANTGVHEVTADSDRLTSLPLQIRYTILSLLPLASAVQTSVLSKGWKYSWKNIRRLSFEENATLSHNIGRLSYLYEKLKVALQGQTLDEFVLRLHSPTIVPVSAWIDEAIGKNIRTLDINVDIIDLPESFFVSGTLSNLKIRCVGFVRDNINEVHVDLPKLVSFDTSCHQEVASVVLHIMRGCPSLHTLTLSNCSFKRNVSSAYGYHSSRTEYRDACSSQHSNIKVPFCWKDVGAHRPQIGTSHLLTKSKEIGVN